MNTFGVGYNFYKPIDYKNGTYKNVNLNFLGTNRKITLKKVLQKLKHYIKQKV